jgi:hypothetical protein
MTSATVTPLWVLFLLTRSLGISIITIYRQCPLDRVDYELFPLYFAWVLRISELVPLAKAMCNGNNVEINTLWWGKIKTVGIWQPLVVSYRQQ